MMADQGTPALALLYRAHRGHFDDSMRTLRTITGFADLVAAIRDDRQGWPDQHEVTPDVVAVKPYGYDPRTGWDTHIVTVKGRAVGYINAAVDARMATHAL